MVLRFGKINVNYTMRELISIVHIYTTL